MDGIERRAGILYGQWMTTEDRRWFEEDGTGVIALSSPDQHAFGVAEQRGVYTIMYSPSEQTEKR